MEPLSARRRVNAATSLELALLGEYARNGKHRSLPQSESLEASIHNSDYAHSPRIHELDLHTQTVLPGKQTQSLVSAPSLMLRRKVEHRHRIFPAENP